MTYQTPTMAPFCKDEEKYQIVDLISKQFKEFKENKTKINDQLIKEIITINGVRFVLEDNSWGLIRASSNKPSLVVVVETLKSDKDTKNIFDFIDRTLQKTGKVGEYDQKI
jgi:phosphomannomutase/phosphoglucomutase